MAVQPTWIRNVTDGSSPWDKTKNPNSAKILFPAGFNMVDALDTFEAVITGSLNGTNQGPPGGGWTYYDNYTPANTGSSFISTTYGYIMPYVAQAVSGVNVDVGFILYFKDVAGATSRQIFCYKDAAMTQLVFQSSVLALSALVAAAGTQQNSSNLFSVFTCPAITANTTVTGVFVSGFRVYRSLNMDGVTYKYVSVDIASQANLFFLIFCEAWNTTTHVSVSGGSSLPSQKYDQVSGSSLYIWVTPRWFCSLSWTTIWGNAGTTAIGIPSVYTEVTRSNPEDTPTAAWPCYGSYSIAGFNIPRSPFGPSTIYLLISPTIGAGGNNMGTNYWTGRNVAETQRVYYQAGIVTDRRGLLYGIKHFTDSTGVMLDEAIMTCDSNGYFSDPSGVNVTHSIIAVTATSRIVIPK